MGKGSKRRPQQISDEEMELRWQMAFSKWNKPLSDLAASQPSQHSSQQQQSQEQHKQQDAN